MSFIYEQQNKNNKMRLKKDHFISSPSSCKYTEEIKMVKVKNTLPQAYR